MSLPDSAPAPVLFAYAHPDDESFGVGGTMTLLRRAGVPVTLVCATRGEAGNISDEALSTKEALGRVREGELRAAMAATGVEDVRFLGYHDSGMDGTPENDNPLCLVQAPMETVAGDVAAIIRQVRPAAVVTFGVDGIYGHPDHLAIHLATTRAVHLAAEPTDGGAAPWQTPRFYYQTSSRERLTERAKLRQGPFATMGDDVIARLGTPEADISFILDVGPVFAEKQSAILAHRTQFGPAGPMAELPPDQVREMLSREYFVRVDLPWSTPDMPSDPIHALELAHSVDLSHSTTS